MNEGISNIFAVQITDWVQCTHLKGRIKRLKVSGKDVSLARRYECIMDIVINQGFRVLFQALDLYKSSVHEVGSGLAEIMRVMKKIEFFIIQFKVEHFKQRFLPCHLRSQ